MDDKTRMKYKIEHYNLLTQNFEKALNLARPVLTRYNGKNFNKRLVNQINEVVNRFDDLITVIKNPYSHDVTAFQIYLYPRMYDLPGGEVMYAEGHENIVHMTFYTDEEMKFLAEKTISDLESHLEKRKVFLERLKNELENYDELMERRNELIEQVREFNKALTYCSNELRIDRKDVW